jgi:DNA-binding transcriptional LysR family regulator
LVRCDESNKVCNLEQFVIFIRTMDLNRALTFVRVVEDGGFTAAARALRVPKSSVSRSVALLEAELGVRLLQRSTRKVQLTDAGQIYYDQASRALAALVDAAAAVTDLQSSLRGTLRITAPADASAGLLAPIIARFVEQHPAVYVECVLTGRVVDLVAEGIDFAFRAAAITDSSLVARKLAPLDGSLYAAPSYLARHGAPTQVADLAGHECVLFRGDRGRTRWTLSSASGEENVQVHGAISADDFAFVHQACLEGAGIALLPQFLAKPSFARGELARVLPGHLGIRGDWHLVYPTGRYLPRRAAAFRDFMLAALGPTPTA